VQGKFPRISLLRVAIDWLLGESETEQALWADDPARLTSKPPTDLSGDSTTSSSYLLAKWAAHRDEQLALKTETHDRSVKATREKQGPRQGAKHTGDRTRWKQKAQHDDEERWRCQYSVH
jgi:hypothetical protein